MAHVCFLWLTVYITYEELNDPIPAAASDVPNAMFLR